MIDQAALGRDVLQHDRLVHLLGDLVDRRQYGPVEEDVLRQWAREGRLRPTDSVWTEGWAEWAPASGVPGLFGGVPAAGPPPPPRERGATVGIAPPGGTGGRTPVTQLMSQGWQAMEGRWGIGIGFFLLFFLIVQAVGPVGIILLGPLLIGQAIFILTLIRRGQPQIGMMFDGFKNFGNALSAYLLRVVFILAAVLVFMLVGVLIGLAVGAATVPEAGIVAGILTGYLPALVASTIVNLMLSQTFYLMADNNSLGAMDALKASRDMMRGHKLRLFGLSLLLGLISLAAALVTCMIGAILLAPWLVAVQARFYEDLLPPRAEAGAGPAPTQPALPAAPEAPQA